ncbi:hypothetical protein B0H13DRAFT_1915175 [Mycena leptocephala]|nr:hypothetical protein B0H13DRAFT_1915175 [Mycena leptocephala]
MWLTGHIVHSDDDEIPFIQSFYFDYPRRIVWSRWLWHQIRGAGSQGFIDPSVLNRAGVSKGLLRWLERSNPDGESTPHRQPGAVAARSARFSAAGTEMGCILILHSQSTDSGVVLILPEAQQLIDGSGNIRGTIDPGPIALGQEESLILDCKVEAVAAAAGMEERHSQERPVHVVLQPRKGPYATEHSSQSRRGLRFQARRGLTERAIDNTYRWREQSDKVTLRDDGRFRFFDGEVLDDPASKLSVSRLGERVGAVRVRFFFEGLGREDFEQTCLTCACVPHQEKPPQNLATFGQIIFQFDDISVNGRSIVKYIKQQGILMKNTEMESNEVLPVAKTPRDAKKAKDTRVKPDLAAYLLRNNSPRTTRVLAWSGLETGGYWPTALIYMLEVTTRSEVEIGVARDKSGCTMRQKGFEVNYIQGRKGHDRATYANGSGTMHGPDYRGVIEVLM